MKPSKIFAIFFLLFFGVIFLALGIDILNENLGPSLFGFILGIGLIIWAIRLMRLKKDKIIKRTRFENIKELDRLIKNASLKSYILLVLIILFIVISFYAQFFITLTIISFLVWLWHRMSISEWKNKKIQLSEENLQKTEKRRKRKQQIQQESFEKSQLEKGLELFEGKWVDKKEIPKLKEMRVGLDKNFQNLSLYKNLTKLDLVKQKRTIDINRNISKKINNEKLNYFFQSIKQSNPNKPEDVKEDVYIGTNNFNLFYNFISNAKESLDISTNVFSDRTLIELFNFIKNKSLKVRIISAREKDKEYDFKQFFKDYPLDVEIKTARNHSKIIIADSERVLTGSSNLDESSLFNFLETNIIFSDKSSVKSAVSIFDSLFKERNIKRENSNFYISGNSNEDLPKCLKNFVLKEKEMFIIMPLGLFHKKVLDEIVKWNPKLKIKIFLGNNVPKGESNKLDRATFNFLRDLDRSENKNVEIIFKKEIIHSKVYLFKKQEKVLISSMNMTFDSWSTLLESAYLTNKKDHLEKILNYIESLENDSVNLTCLEVTESSKQPITPLNERLNDLDRIEIPWKLAGDDPDWIFYKYKKERDYVFIKKENKREIINEKEPPKAREVFFKKEKKVFTLLNQAILNYLNDESKPKKIRLEEVKRYLRRNKNKYELGSITPEEYNKNNKTLFFLEEKISKEF